MSLGRRYHVQCDSRTLLRRTGVDDFLRLTIHRVCVVNGPTEGTSTKARAAAKRKGWERRTVDLPLADGSTTPVKYDICPQCKTII